MTPKEGLPQRVAIIGGGITGLAAAHRLVELNPACQPLLLERQSRLGGVLDTIHEGGLQVEQSADNFITTVPWGVELCKRLGLNDQLVQTNPAYRQTFVVRKGRLHKLPDGFLMMAPTRLWPLAVTPLLSFRGKMRAALEYFIPPRKDDSDESMASFVRRRWGREVFERLVEPLVSAVYAADLEKLSVKATLSRFPDMERQYGSLIRAMRYQMASKRKSESQSGPRYSLFVTLRHGLSSLVKALAQTLPAGSVRLNAEVVQIQRGINGGWKLLLSDGTFEQCDALILATPAHMAARLLEPFDSELAAGLSGIPYSGTAIVSVAYDRPQIGHSLDGMGVVIPAVEQSVILGCSFVSQKYPHRAPPGQALLRAFVGGAGRPELAGMDDAELRPLVLAELARLLDIRAEPTYCHIAHWPETMPQYHVGHRQRIQRIEDRLHRLPGIQLAGNAYHGVGLPECIASGEQAAQRLLGTAATEPRGPTK